jgi:zinc protease
MRPIAAAPRDYHFPRFTRHHLPNGLGIIVAPVTKLPLLTVLAVIDAGATVEPTDQQGIAALTARLLLEGAGALDGNALSDQIERIGASIESHADWDVTVTSLTVLRSRLTEALALMRDLLTQPTFPEREVARLKEERLAELLQQLTEPRTLADDRFSQALYEQGARYALPEAGDSDGIRAIGREQIVAFHRARYQPSQVTLVFAGDITESDAIAMSEQLFGDWSGTGVPAAAEKVDAARSGRLVRVVGKADAPQSELRVGHVGLSRSVADYFPTTVMNAVLGGLFSSRINLNLREVHGYTYGAFSVFDWRRHTGPFVVSTAVKSEVTGASVREILTEIDRMRLEAIAEDELTLATSYLDGVFPIRYETTSAIAAALANMVVYGLPLDYYDTYRDHVRAVTTVDVLRAAQAHLHPDAMRIVVVGNPEVVADQLAEVTGLAVEVTRADEATVPS